MKNLNESKRIFVAGHNGMVGSAISYQLEKDPKIEIIKMIIKNLKVLVFI